MAMMYYMELHELRSLKSKAVINNNLEAYCDCLEELYIAVSFKLTKSEQSFIEKKIKEAKSHLSIKAVSNVRDSVKNYSLTQVKEILKEVDKSLIKTMHKNGMIFPKIEAKGLSTLNKRYGIQK